MYGTSKKKELPTVQTKDKENEENCQAYQDQQALFWASKFFYLFFTTTTIFNSNIEKTASLAIQTNEHRVELNTWKSVIWLGKTKSEGRSVKSKKCHC